MLIFSMGCTSLVQVLWLIEMALGIQEPVQCCGSPRQSSKIAFQVFGEGVVQSPDAATTHSEFTMSGSTPFLYHARQQSGRDNPSINRTDDQIVGITIRKKARLIAGDSSGLRLTQTTELDDRIANHRGKIPLDECRVTPG